MKGKPSLVVGRWLQASRCCLQITLACIPALLLLGCTRQPAAEASKPETASTILPSLTEGSNVPNDPGPFASINANRAMQYTKEIVAFGARPIGSPAHKKLE